MDAAVASESFQPQSAESSACGGWQSEPGEAPWRRRAPVLAALDLGTNNCRLLIARPQRDGFRIIDAFSRVVRLGEGLTRSDHLSDEAMGRTVSALKVCRSKMDRRGVTLARAVATEACRRAGNCREFLERVQSEAGLDLEIISTREEARLALNGCAPLLNPFLQHAIVFDIGGGSTELMWIRIQRGRPKLIDQVSIPLGVVNLTELHGGDRVTQADYQAMVGRVAAAIAPFEQRNHISDMVRAGRVQMLGASGTVTTLAGIRIGLQRYDRSKVDGTWLPRTDARDISRKLLELDYLGRAEYACVGRDRADLVIAGCAVLEAIWDLWPVSQLRIADRGVREGILFDLAASARHRD
ncbi:Ppx/GppA phosphatase family protein [Indioceanicola profundi]|uniref:Ppx/GppA phosphatase family protein n=1 Tax=Indioceanicola profundi TaxID=2220096 RepID=UPI001CED90CC|nr:Ppx/GppA phosphatase family protein [Indioceanicola profundi]